MDKTTQERIKADADQHVKGLSIQHSKAHQHAGYIAGATAENDRNESIKLQLEAQNANVEILLAQKNDLIERAQKLVDALEQYNIRHEGGLLPDRFTYEKGVKALKGWSGKEVERPTEVTLPDLGICAECKTRPATTDYNEHGHFVCKLCSDSLNREFDEQYK